MNSTVSKETDKVTEKSRVLAMIGETGHDNVVVDVGRLRKDKNTRKALDLPWGVFHSKEKAYKRNGCFSWMRFMRHLEREFIRERECIKAIDSLKPRNIYLLGPKGVPQREIAMEIAQVMERPFQEIRINKDSKAVDLLGSPGQMGLVMRAVKKARCCNPVILIDGLEEVDDEKVLKILMNLGNRDRNENFIDRYCEVPFDLSNILFILSENNFKGHAKHFVHFKIIGIYESGMRTEEKITVMKKKAIPKLIAKYGLKPTFFGEHQLEVIIQNFIAEYGVDQLTEALTLLGEKKNPKQKKLTRTYLEKFFGQSGSSITPENYIEVKEDNQMMVGGARLLGVYKEYTRLLEHFTGMFSQFSDKDTIHNRTPTLHTTVAICLSLLHRCAERYAIQQSIEKKVRVVYARCDGSSAGFSTFLSLFSLFSGRRLRCDSACSGEVRFSGELWSIGGVYLKSLAAYKNGIRRIVLPRRNLRRERMLLEINELAEKNSQLQEVATDLEAQIAEYRSKLLNLDGQ
ncbi:hypothetical protein QR680_002508 [Steinernema hermaphroditum]|uniref:Lon proteolytic domain-containing protein n=1 Tax=Steinernema hermaphroditum TaxID=289476 RepID=A0AA39H544_9BILA|nr:hypothetical protein QR680_002508 [Steinernema hermaphroditum]